MTDHPDPTLEDLDQWWDDGDPVEVENLATRSRPPRLAGWSGDFAHNAPVHAIEAEKLTVTPG
ncbi:hypothetical protein FTX61_04235 [Nitriliruptoraceae bacterium ZYF776]|nr:hypothetical protein [Profundirhabdus halotolerans]